MCGDGGDGGDGGENVCLPAYEDTWSYIGGSQGGAPNYADNFCGDPGDWP